MNKKLSVLKYTAFGMLFASMILIILGIYFYMEKDKELKTYKLIKCKIIRIDEPTRGDAVLTFKDINGNYPAFKYKVHYDASEENLDYELNEICEVYYNDKDVSKSEIKDFVNNYEAGFFLIVIGFVFLLDFPIMLFVISVNKKRQNTATPSQYGIKGSVMSE